MNDVVFKVKACNFQGTPGYIFKKFIDGNLVFEQFISEDTFSWFQKFLKISFEIE